MSNGAKPVIGKYDLVPFMKQEFPDSSFVKGKADYDIYEAGKAYYHSHDSSLVFDENPYIKFDTDRWIDDTSNEKTVDYTPDAFNYAEAALRGDAPDLGLSEEALMYTYNNSFAGASYVINNGEFKYPVTDYEPEGMDEVASFVAGTLNPTDAIMFWGSAGIGNLLWKKTAGVGTKWLLGKYLANAPKNKLVQQGVAGRARDKVIKNVVDPIVNKNTEHLANKIFDRTIASSGSLGGYMAAVGTSEEAKKQAFEIKNPELAKQMYGENYEERTEFNYLDLATKGAAGFGEGVATGLVTGPAGVFTGKVFKPAIARAGNAWAKQGLKLAKSTAELGVEATGFTGMGYLFHGGPDGFQDAMGDVGVAGAILGILRLPRAARALSDGIKDINAASKNGVKQSKIKTPIEISSKNVAEDLKNQRLEEGVDVKSNAEKLLEENIGKKNKALLENDKNLSELQTIVIESNKLLKQGDLEGADRIVAESSGYTALTGLRGFYDKLLKDEAYRKQLGVNDAAELEANKIIWNNKLKNIDKVLDIPNQKQGTENYANNIVDEIEAGKVKGTFAFTEKVIKEKSKELGMDLAQYDLKKISGRRAATWDIEAREGTLSERAVLLEKAKTGQLAYEEASNIRKAEIRAELEAAGLSKAQGTEMTPTEYANKRANWEIVTNKGRIKVSDNKLTENQLIIRKYFNNPDNKKLLKNVPEDLQIIATDFALKNIGKSITKQQIKDFKQEKMNDGSWEGFTKEQIADAVVDFKQGKKSWEGTTKHYTKEAIVLTEYLSKLGKNLSTMEVSDLDRFMQIRNHLSTINHAATTGLNKLIQHLHQNDYIKEKRLDDFKEKLAATKQAQNEMTRAGLKDSEPGSRKIGLEVGKELGKKGDTSGELASILGAKYLIRLAEIPRLRFHHIKKHGKDWYIDATADFRKARTFNRYIWLEPKFAQRLMSYLKPGDKTITTKTLSQALKEHPFFAKNQGDRTAGKEPFYSFRRRGSVVGEQNLKDHSDYMAFKFLKGHDLTADERVYQGNRDIGETIRIQKGIHGLIKTGKNIGSSASHQLEPLGEPFTSKQALEKFLQRRIRIDKSLKFAIESDKDYAGKFHKGIIHLTEGKSNPHTFFHEMGHKLQDFVKLTKNKELINLIERGKKMFSKEAQAKGYSRAELRNMETSELVKIAKGWKLDEKINLSKYKNAKRGSNESKTLVGLMLEHQKNEFFMDRMADYGAGMSSTVRSKIASWGKLMLSKLKKVFFGKENLNKHDIARLLGEKVYKGIQADNSIFIGQRAKYKIKNVQGFTSDLRTKVRDLIADTQKISVKEAKAIEADFIQAIAEKAGIENPHKFRITTKYAKNTQNGADNLIKFYEHLTSPEISKLQKKHDIVRWMKEFDKVDELRTNSGITEKKQSEILRDFLDIDDIRKTSVNELKQYKALIGQLGYKPIVEKTWAQDIETFSEMHPDLVNKRSFFDGLSITTLGPITILKKLGGKYDELAKKWHSHNSSYLDHLGTFDKLQYDAMARLAGFPKTVDASLASIGKGRVMFEKIKNFIPLTMNKKSYYEHRKEGTLEKGHEKFFNKVYHKNGQMKDTPEAQVVKLHQEFNKYIREQFELIAQLKIENPAKYEKFLKKNGIQWQDPKTYVPNIFTQEFKDAYPVESINSSKLLKNLIREIATDEAIKKHPNLSNTEIQKKLPDFMQYAEFEAQRRVYDQRNYADPKSISKFFLPKKVNFPEFWDSSRAGKRIQVHETGYEATIERMAYSQSLYLANFEWFPEHIKLKGYKHSGKDSKTMIVGLKRTNPKWGEYIDRNLKAHLGIGDRKGATVWDSMAGKMVKPATQTLAKTLLMFPVHALKNFMVGEYMSMHLFGPYRTIYSHLKSINHQNRIDLINAGVRTVGIKHLMAPTGIFRDVTKSNVFLHPVKKFANKLHFNKILDEMFHYISLMKQSEALNRYTSGGASKIETHFLADVLRNYPSNHIKYERAVNKLSDTYEMTSREIELFKKYGMGGAEGHGLTGFDDIKTERNLHNIYQKMITQGHIKSQGSSQEMFFPEWTSTKGVKEGTLFLRMAYKSNLNAYYNTKAAFRSRNKVEASILTSMQILGPLATGATLLAINSKVFGKAMPQENDTWWDKMLVTLMAGEFGALAGGLFNRMNDGLLNLVLISAAQRYVAIIQGLAGETMTPSQGADEFLKASSSLYRHGKQLYMKAKYPDVLQRKKIGSWYKDFDKKVHPDKPDDTNYNNFQKSKSSPFYKDLRKEFEMGSVEDFIRQWQLTYIAEVTKLFTPGQHNFGEGKYNMKDAMAQAEKNMRNYAYALNPNPANYDKEKWQKGKAPVQTKLNKWFTNYLSGDGPIVDRKWTPVYKTRDGKGTTTDISKAQRFKNGQPMLEWSENPPKIKELWEAEAKYNIKFEKLFYEGERNKNLKDGMLKTEFLTGEVWWYTDKDGLERFMFEKNKDKIPKDAKNIRKGKAFNILKAMDDSEDRWRTFNFWGED